VTVDSVTHRTRRSLLLGALGGLAAAATATMAGAQRVLAAGDDGLNVQVGHDYLDARNATVLFNQTDDSTVFSASSGHGGDGVYGGSDTGDGVHAVSSYGTGVHGESLRVSGFSSAILGDVTNPDGVAVLGNNYAKAGNAQGIQGTSDSPHGLGTTGWARHNGTGVVGVSGGTFPSVPAHTGVFGSAHSGRGVVASGGVAQLRLVPSSDTSHPHSGAMGDLFLDKHGRLWFCRGGTSWHQLA